MATVTVRGEVEVADYDDDDGVTEVAIYDSDWGSVLVLDGGKGADLLDEVGAVVSARGLIRELDEDGEYPYAIEVRSYRIVEPAKPEEDPGYV
jgi:hypothetical protein